MKDLGDQKQSRLELYVDILKTLGEEEALNIKAIQGITKIETTDLSARNEIFSATERLIQLHNVGNRIEYQKTPHVVYGYLDIIPEALALRDILQQLNQTWGQLVSLQA